VPSDNVGKLMIFKLLIKG